jgi:heme-degrading monooxygenase HmoA
MLYLFEVHIKPGYTADDYAAAWVEASKLIQQAPGARGTRLHRKLDDPSVLIAIAQWESKAERDAMERAPNPEIADIIRRAAPFCEIHPIGEFDDAVWVVLPPDSQTSQNDSTGFNH